MDRRRTADDRVPRLRIDESMERFESTMEAVSKFGDEDDIAVITPEEFAEESVLESGAPNPARLLRTV